jgi:hypothetical protein
MLDPYEGERLAKKNDHDNLFDGGEDDGKKKRLSKAER